MLQSLDVKHFTVYTENRFEWSPQLNVVIGENGTGKSHLLKLLYCTATASKSMTTSSRTGKEEFQRIIADSLTEVFQPDSLGRLVSRQQGRNRAEVRVGFSKQEASYRFQFASNSKTDVKLDATPTLYLSDSVIFFPTREMLSVFPGFIATYTNRMLHFDRTYFDLAQALAVPPLKGPKPQQKDLIKQLETVVGGRVVLENGRFYLNTPGTGNLEITLVAEGIRKIAMLLHLLVNGQLKQHSVLIWDEPETNLNPRLLKQLVQGLIILAKSGIQVILATHSLYLLREIYIQQKSESSALDTRFFNLLSSTEGIQVSTGTSLEDVQNIAALDEDLHQSERFFDLMQGDPNERG